MAEARQRELLAALLLQRRFVERRKGAHDEAAPATAAGSGAPPLPPLPAAADTEALPRAATATDKHSRSRAALSAALQGLRQPNMTNPLVAVTRTVSAALERRERRLTAGAASHGAGAGSSGSSDAVSELCGWMLKRGRAVQNWKMRWIMLQAGELLYFRNSSRRALLGGMYLRDCAIEAGQTARHLSVRSQSRTLHLMAADERDALAWRHSIRLAIREAGRLPDANGAPSSLRLAPDFAAALAPVLGGRSLDEGSNLDGGGDGALPPLTVDADSLLAAVLLAVHAVATPADAAAVLTARYDAAGRAGRARVAYVLLRWRQLHTADFFSNPDGAAECALRALWRRCASDDGLLPVEDCLETSIAAAMPFGLGESPCTSIKEVRRSASISSASSAPMSSATNSTRLTTSSSIVLDAPSSGRHNAHATSLPSSPSADAIEALRVGALRLGAQMGCDGFSPAWNSICPRPHTSHDAEKPVATLSASELIAALRSCGLQDDEFELGPSNSAARVLSDPSRVKVDDGICMPLRAQLRFLLSRPYVNICAREWLAFSPRQLAEYLALRDAELFQHVSHDSLLCYTWSAETRDQGISSSALNRKQPLLEITHVFNATAETITSAVVSTPSLHTRSRLLSHFVMLASELLRLSDLNGVMAVLAGIGSSAVTRMRATRVCLDRRVRARWDSLAAMTDPEGSFRRYRAVLAEHARRPPYTPYLGVHLTDLTFLGHGNADRIDGQLNLSKPALVLDTVELVLRGRCEAYTHVALPGVDRLFECGRLSSLGTEEELHRVSLLREPRGLTVEEIVRAEQSLGSGGEASAGRCEAGGGLAAAEISVM